MAFPAPLTRSRLAEYAEGEFAEVAAYLGWSAEAGHFAEAVDDALLDYPTDDPQAVTDAGGVALLRALVRLKAAQRIKRAIVHRYDFGAGGQTFNRSQMVKGLESAIKDAREDVVEAKAVIATASGGAGVAVLSLIDETGRDPYVYVPARDRVW